MLLPRVWLLLMVQWEEPGEPCGLLPGSTHRPQYQLSQCGSEALHNPAEAPSLLGFTISKLLPENLICSFAI